VKKQWTNQPGHAAQGTLFFSCDGAGHLLCEYGGSATLIEEIPWPGDIPVATVGKAGGSKIRIRPGIYWLATSARIVTRPMHACWRSALRSCCERQVWP
jgi:hypothetical protein